MLPDGSVNRAIGGVARMMPFNVGTEKFRTVYVAGTWSGSTWVVMADPEGNLFCLVAD